MNWFEELVKSYYKLVFIQIIKVRVVAILQTNQIFWQVRLNDIFVKNFCIAIESYWSYAI